MSWCEASVHLLGNWPENWCQSDAKTSKSFPHGLLLSLSVLPKGRWAALNNTILLILVFYYLKAFLDTITYLHFLKSSYQFGCNEKNWMTHYDDTAADLTTCLWLGRHMNGQEMASWLCWSVSSNLVRQVHHHTLSKINYLDRFLCPVKSPLHRPLF